jgi:putative membrane protein
MGDFFSKTDVRADLDEQDKFRVSLFLLGMVYGFGLWGMYTAYASWFVLMTPLSLLLSYVLLLWNETAWDFGKRVFWFLAFVIGFGMEVCGVNTGFPFGDYEYGSVLGLKVWNTPLLIGINWTLVVYTSNIVAHRMGRWGGTWLVLLLGASIPTFLDVFIEPVAIRLGYWSWAGGVPPFQNYVGLLFRRFVGRRFLNPLAFWLLGFQLIFFLGLQWL